MRILIIDDEKAIRESLRDILEYEHYQVDDADSGMKALATMQQCVYDVVLCDIKMPQMDGIEVMEKARDYCEAPFIMISGHGTIDTAVEAIKKGAYDFISKPLDLNRLLVSVRNAFEKKTLVVESKTLKKRIALSDTFIGESPAIRQALSMVEKVAPTDARVLILGESGTGKELIARRIHALSRRASRPMVELNCAAIPTELIESELFGHEKGAFTSALKQRIGKLEQADDTTLFLDEIGDMSLSAQAKVLRALEEQTIVRIGGDKMIKTNARIVAATNKNLKEEIQCGRFREDLYHRLNVIEIFLPPLRERREDIPLLVEHLLKELAAKNGRQPLKINVDAMQALSERNWPGNVRELRNAIERLLIFADQSIQLEDITTYVPK